MHFQYGPKEYTTEQRKTQKQYRETTAVHCTLPKRDQRRLCPLCDTGFPRPDPRADNPTSPRKAGEIAEAHSARTAHTPASHRAAACEKRRRDTKSCARCGNCSRWGNYTATSHGSMESVAWGPRWSMDTVGLPPAWSMVTLGCAVTPEGCVVT